MKVWLWRAWNAKRERICDCGTAHARTVGEAERIAWILLGGPHAGAVAEMQVEEIPLTKAVQ